MVDKNSIDLEIIARITSGDQEAFRDLVKRHKSYAYTIAIRIVGIKEDAEEVAQDAFIKAFNALKNFNKESKFTTWFYKIVFNEALARKRKMKVHQSLDGLDFSAGNNANEGLRKEEQKRFINQAIAKLSEDDAMIITLFYFQEFSIEEMSEITSITVNNVKVRLHRARKRLAEELKDILNFEVRSIM